MADMFLYNGVKLPKLPTSPQTSSLIICLTDNGEYTLYAIEGTPTLWTDGSIYGSNNGKIYIYYNENDEWIYSHYIYQSSSYAIAGIKPGQGTVWSNKDIYAKTDNSLYIAASTPVPAYCLTFSSPEPFTLSVYNQTKNWDGTLYYSTDGNTWPEWDGATTLSSAEIDGENKLFMRGSGNSVIAKGSNNERWVLTGCNISCEGNIENLLDCEDVENGDHPVMGSHCYAYMFYDNIALIHAPELPATVLSEGCYSHMFTRTGLTIAPELPATTMTAYCYSGMFNTTNIFQAPKLPATILASYCYSGMFAGCGNMIQSPELPAMVLARGCYSTMFWNCFNLVNAPELPATTMVGYCYSDMFNGCTSLNIPPELPATELDEYCYQDMFDECISLVALPELPATRLSKYCYRRMFSGCTGIKLSVTETDEYRIAYRIPTSGTGSTASNALTNMFSNTGGTFTGTPEINTTYYLYDPNYQPELPKLNPCSLMPGYLAGQKVRQLRSKLANTPKTLTFSQLWGEVDPKTATLTMGELDSLDQEYLPYGIVGSNNTVTLKGKTLIVEGELDDDQREDTEEASE